FPTVVSEPSERNEESGWVAIARPSSRTTGHGQAPTRVAASGQGCQQLARKGWRSPTAKPQGQRPRPAHRGATPIEAPPVGMAPDCPRAAARGQRAYRRRVQGGH
ncbi:hypothetical protein GW17_00045139, partial [Ensete ventricosum]